MSAAPARGLRPVWLAVLLLGGAAVWIVIDLRSALQGQTSQLESWRTSAESERLAAEQRLGTAVADAVGREATAHAVAQAELQAQLLSAQSQVATLTSERDQALADLAQASSSEAALRERLTVLESGQTALSQELAASKDQHLRQVGESARLLDQVLERDRRLDLLNRSLADLRQQQVVATQPAAVVTVSRGEGPAAQASEALRRSGAPQAVVLEARLGEDGVLHGVLARLTGDDQPARLISAESASLAFASGRASLRLQGLSGDVGEAADVIDIDLPSFDSGAWVLAGLAVPSNFKAASAVSLALGALLDKQGWHLDALHGVDGATLLGIELSQQDANGQVLRTVRAPRAMLSPGPELTLWNGTVTTGGDERGFFGGIFNLPLPGLDTAAWSAALGSSAP